MTVAMCHRETVERLCALFGRGNVYPREGTGNQKPYWNWNVSGRAVAECLVQVQPYLFTKATHAEIAIRFASLLGKRSGFSRLPEDALSQRGDLFEAMRGLNRRGIG